MEFKIGKNKIIISIVIILILTLSFYYGDNDSSSGSHDREVSQEENIIDKALDLEEDSELFRGSEEEPEEDTFQREEASLEIELVEDSLTSVKEDPKDSIDSQDTETDEELTATLSVRCHTILDNMDKLDPEKIELVPEEGIIYPEETIIFYQGESVFNVLQREMKNAKIHMEFSNTPMYDSIYIKGINNIYEYDCGELSGWMYKVNDWFPNYGASQYVLQEGDIIELLYTCDLGEDIGGFNDIGGSD